jgi:hypothetical protein
MCSSFLVTKNNVILVKSNTKRFLLFNLNHIFSKMIRFNNNFKNIKCVNLNTPLQNLQQRQQLSNSEITVTKLNLPTTIITPIDQHQQLKQNQPLKQNKKKRELRTIDDFEEVQFKISLICLIK